MQKQILFLFFLLTIVFFSCTREDPIGIWDDNIHLSTKHAEFDAGADSVIITTEGTGWWIIGASVNNESFNSQEIDVEADQYIIEQDGVTVERRNQTTLFIHADANPSSEPRIIRVELEAGDYFDAVTVTQKGQ